MEGGDSLWLILVGPERPHSGYNTGLAHRNADSIPSNTNGLGSRASTGKSLAQAVVPHIYRFFFSCGKKKKKEFKEKLSKEKSQ